MADPRGFKCSRRNDLVEEPRGCVCVNVAGLCASVWIKPIRWGIMRWCIAVIYVLGAAGGRGQELEDLDKPGRFEDYI